MKDVHHKLPASASRWLLCDYLAHLPCLRFDLHTLLQEELLAETNPDYDRVVRVAEEGRRTGIVRDKRGHIVGTISNGGVIRDKTGRRIGVAGTGRDIRQRPLSNNVLDGFFGKSITD